MNILSPHFAPIMFRRRLRNAKGVKSDLVNPSMAPDLELHERPPAAEKRNESRSIDDPFAGKNQPTSPAVSPVKSPMGSQESLFLLPESFV
jgi:hypothetical protein